MKAIGFEYLMYTPIGNDDEAFHIFRHSAEIFVFCKLEDPLEDCFEPIRIIVKKDFI